MNNNYLKIKDKLTYLKRDLENVLEEGHNKTFEDGIAYNYVEDLIERLDTAIYKIEHFSKSVIEGTLQETDGGKFELLDRKGKYVTYFSCGSPIECYVEYDGDLQWVSGRVEHTTRDGYSGYYFYGGEKPFLYSGMRARVRD